MTLGGIGAGLYRAMSRRTEFAIKALTASIQLNPSFALAHAMLGMAHNYAGLADVGMQHIHLALKLSPKICSTRPICRRWSLPIFHRGRYGARPKPTSAVRRLGYSDCGFGRGVEAAAKPFCGMDRTASSDCSRERSNDISRWFARGRSRLGQATSQAFKATGLRTSATGRFPYPTSTYPPPLAMSA